MATQIIEKLVAELGFQINDKQLNTFDEKLKNIQTSMKRIAGVGTLVISAIAGITKASANSAERIVKTSDRVNIATKDYQTLSNAITLAGESTSSLDSALDSLSKKAKDARIGDKGAIAGFKLLSITGRELNEELTSSDKLLFRVAEQLKNLKDNTLRRQVLTNLGIDETFGKFLEKGEENLKSFIKEAEKTTFIFDDEAIKRLDDVNKGYRDLAANVKSLRDQLAVELAPAASRFLDILNSIAGSAREIISEAETYPAAKDPINAVSNLSKGIFDQLNAFSAGFANKTRGIIGSAINVASDSFDNARSYLTGASTIDNSRNEKNQITNNVTINIQNADNANEIADEIVTTLDLRTAGSNLQGGIRR